MLWILCYKCICYKYEYAATKCVQLQQNSVTVFVRTQKRTKANENVTSPFSTLCFSRNSYFLCFIKKKVLLSVFFHETEKNKQKKKRTKIIDNKNSISVPTCILLSTFAS